MARRVVINQQHLCLTFHCLRDGGAAPVVYPELSIDVQDMRALFEELKNQGYRFCLPKDAADYKEKTCSVTFDDGYFNNTLFLKIAEEFQIPFILFVASYNIVNQIPYVWDIMQSLNKAEWGFAEKNYESIYKNLKHDEYRSLQTDSHRPFTLAELKNFESHSLAYLGLHSHTHQPLVGNAIKNIDAELDENIKFLSQFKKALTKDLALPNGLYSRQTLAKLLSRCERVYTIQGGSYTPNQSVIPRISLINPDTGGPLMAQIAKSFSFKRSILRKFVTMRYA